MALTALREIGQSVWLDFIRRSFTTSGGLQRLVDQGVRGVTSNPSIFEKAIAGSDDYDNAMRGLVEAGRSVDEIYESLALEDIGRAADILRPVYEESACADGFVSLEVSPALAQDTERTIAEARRLFAVLNRPNIMIKVPATPAGIPAIETLIGQGINVNATLIFSLAHYEAVAQAYMAGLERLAATGPAGALGRVASVASFFVSRIDTAVDRVLEGIGETELAGKIAIASARVAYGRFREIFRGKRWERLVAQGARVQRPLWASTSTKNPLYPDTLYVDSLIGPDTVNTIPPDTLEAFLDHGRVSPSLEAGIDEAGRQMGRLSELGIDLDAITEKLQEEGVAAFAKAFDGLMDSIAGKREQLLTEGQFLTLRLGRYQEVVDQALDDFESRKIVERIWAHDHTVWKPEPTEITNRLGWLHIAETMRANLDQLEALTASIRAEGYTDVLLLGMGGSSLAPQVFRQTFGLREGYVDLAALDSTDPGAVLAHAEQLEPARTLFVVATKSGRTVETLSFFKYFYNWTAEALGQDQAGQHFVAITDPGSHLAELASRHGFRAVFLNDPHIGGRYSALSYFGLVAAALVGVDLKRLLDRAVAMAGSCGAGRHLAARGNDGVRLGVVLAELAKAGRDKVTFIISPAIASFGDWVEQLIAESTGKEGKGILPVVGEPITQPEAYGDDRLFVDLRLNGDHTHDAAVRVLEDAGHPVVRLQLKDAYDLGGQFFLWEFATGVAGSRLGINPFSQPNVEAAKVLARRMVTAYAEKGALPEDESLSPEPGAVTAFLDQAQPGAYIALQAYVQPTAGTDAALLALRTKLRDRYRLATTVGYGPRFLHSTGQLHKGDAGKGLFIQFTSGALADAPIPEEAGSPESNISFGVLKMAQAQGDYQALVNAGRRVLRIHLGRDVIGGLARLAEGVG
jgi:transaldolase/glucose-6-phosphate isomerase